MALLVYLYMYSFTHLFTTYIEYLPGKTELCREYKNK